MIDALPPMMSEQDFNRYSKELIRWFKERSIEFEDMAMLCCYLVGTTVGMKCKTEERLDEGLEIMTAMMRTRALQTMLVLTDIRKANNDRAN